MPSPVRLEVAMISGYAAGRLAMAAMVCDAGLELAGFTASALVRRIW